MSKTKLQQLVEQHREEGQVLYDDCIEAVSSEMGHSKVVWFLEVMSGQTMGINQETGAVYAYNCDLRRWLESAKLWEQEPSEEKTDIDWNEVVVETKSLIYNLDENKSTLKFEFDANGNLSMELDSEGAKGVLVFTPQEAEKLQKFLADK